MHFTSSAIFCFVGIIFSFACFAVAFFVPVLPVVFSEHTICHMSDKITSSSSSCIDTKERRKLPPGKLIVGYANWNQCDEKILDAVQAGVNVVIWFSINLVIDKTNGLPTIENGPDYHCVAKMIQKIRQLDLPTTHLISIGGWNSPHPDTTHSAETVFQVNLPHPLTTSIITTYYKYPIHTVTRFMHHLLIHITSVSSIITPPITYDLCLQAWHEWNTQTIADPSLGFNGFDGFDWDIEGNDDNNIFSLACHYVSSPVSNTYIHTSTHTLYILLIYRHCYYY